MLLHFEDWTSRISIEQLAQRADMYDLPDEGERRLIKIFGSDTDPRTAAELGKPDLTVVTVDDHPFGPDEVLEYSPRPQSTYAGNDLEDMLTGYGLTDLGNRTVRALARFSYSLGIGQEAMQIRDGDSWLIDNPFDEIDGYGRAVQLDGEKSLHLDIFLRGPLLVLKSVVNYDNAAEILTAREGRRLRGPEPPPRRRT